MQVVLKAFSEAARQNYDGHAFEAGYLQSVVVSMMPHLPKRVQKVFIDDMVRATQRQEKEVIAKLTKKETV
jgi:hypothetical protein